MRKYFVSIICVWLLHWALSGRLSATGQYAPDRWLDNGGIASEMSPEFYWELDVKRMAKVFVPPEKRIIPPEAPVDPEKLPPNANVEKKSFTDKIDEADFADAIKSGRIKPAVPDEASEAHKAARNGVVSRPDLPVEFPSEFADYHRGAIAFRSGADYYEKARSAWETLLKRPESERHYRSVWAAFMLGKLALAMDDPAAVQWFRRTRELARAGFADSLGLAADSYGWEAKSELKQQHYEAAAKLYLTQLALGDESAVVSLKTLVPDRPGVDGMMNFGDQPPENASEEDRKKWEESHSPLVQKRLDECAQSPVLRHLVTAHVLATETQGAVWSYGGGYGEVDSGEAPKPGARCLRWLATLEKAGLRQIDDADHLGWVAYTAGRYKEAARWMLMAPPETPTALWLKAKLERRDGKLAPAAATMAVAFKAVEAAAIPFGDSIFTEPMGGRGYAPEQSAAGDLAGLHLTRGDFLDAMDTFLHGNLWEDAAFVGDRILTVDELRKYVDAHYPQPAPRADADVDSDRADDATRLRWMLARRFVRAKRYAEAPAYFPKKERIILDRYTSALKNAGNIALPKTDRAHAIFSAAWIARQEGLELMGTEVEPDGFVSEGEFSPGEIDVERLGSIRITTEYNQKQQRDVTTRESVKMAIPASAAEKKRLAQFEPQPNKRYHYRWVAAELAWRAAAFLDDGSEELADVLNTGGSWIKDRDEKGADKFIQAIERRCPRTEIGRAESVKHWFVDLPGPWSKALQKEDEQRASEASKPQ